MYDLGTTVTSKDMKNDEVKDFSLVRKLSTPWKERIFLVNRNTFVSYLPF